MRGRLRLYRSPLVTSPLAVLAGTAFALSVLWLREPALFTEPTLGRDDLRYFAAQYGEGRIVFHSTGAVHLLTMLVSAAFTRALPVSVVPHAYSLSSLLLAALTPALLLLPALERWLPLYPHRIACFCALVVLPLDTAFLVASLAYQHLNYVLMVFAVLAFAMAPEASAWFERRSLAALGAFAALFAVLVASAPLSIVLVPLPLYTAFRAGRAGRSRRGRFALFAVACLSAYAVLGITTDQAWLLHAWPFSLQNGGPAHLTALAVQSVTLVWERVCFESVFGVSSRLWVTNRLGAGGLVSAIGAVLMTLVGALFLRRKDDRGVPAGAGPALYAALMMPAFAVFGRWHLHELYEWHTTTFRYFAPAAKLFVLAVVILTADRWPAFLRRARFAAAAAAYLLLLNVADNPRYTGALAPALAVNASAQSLHDLGGQRRETSRITLEDFEALDQLASTLPPGEERFFTFRAWDIRVRVRGKL